MAIRIAGVNLPENKRIEVALRYIKGIGLTRSRQILAKANISFDKRARELAEDEVARMRAVIEEAAFELEGELQRRVLGNIKRLKEIGAWRGIRHSKRLPVRGQRTKTNSRTVRGNVRKTATSGKKPTAQKT